MKSIITFLTKIIKLKTILLYTYDCLVVASSTLKTAINEIAHTTPNFKYINEVKKAIKCIDTVKSAVETILRWFRVDIPVVTVSGLNQSDNNKALTYTTEKLDMYLRKVD